MDNACNDLSFIRMDCRWKVSSNFAVLRIASPNHQTMNLLSEDVLSAAKNSVLCWLATVDAKGQPNVSPKEIYVIFDDQHIVVANIASPKTAKNVEATGKVCLTFVDILVQKGFKVTGTAENVRLGNPAFATWAAPLLNMVGQRFPISSVIVVTAMAIEPVIAPSYRFYPAATTEADQMQSALKSYGVAAGRRGP